MPSAQTFRREPTCAIQYFGASARATLEGIPSRDGWTTHARVRCRQRGIPQNMADLLLDWGCFEHLPGGNERVSFRKRDLEKLHKALPKPDWLAVEKQRRLYAVLDGGTLVTIGHRTGHMKRK